MTFQKIIHKIVRRCELVECHKFSNLTNKVIIEYTWLGMKWRETWFGNDNYWIEKDKETLANTRKQKFLSELSTK